MGAVHEVYGVYPALLLYNRFFFGFCSEERQPKTGEGLVKMRSLRRINSDKSETGSGLSLLEKEHRG